MDPIIVLTVEAVTLSSGFERILKTALLEVFFKVKASCWLNPGIHNASGIFGLVDKRA